MTLISNQIIRNNLVWGRLRFINREAKDAILISRRQQIELPPFPYQNIIVQFFIFCIYIFCILYCI